MSQTSEPSQLDGFPDMTLRYLRPYDDSSARCHRSSRRRLGANAAAVDQCVVWRTLSELDRNRASLPNMYAEVLAENIYECSNKRFFNMVPVTSAGTFTCQAA